MTNTPHVLVVEDDPSVRGLLQTLLLAEGYDVSTASDGLAGLVKANRERPSLILLDLMMPDLGGARVLEELDREPDARRRPGHRRHRQARGDPGDGRPDRRGLGVRQAVQRR